MSQTVCGTQAITPSKRNFLRVNAQRHNLDKEKTYACLENVMRHAMGTLLTLNIWTNDNHFLTIPLYKINNYTFDNDKI